MNCDRDRFLNATCRLPNRLPKESNDCHSPFSWFAPLIVDLTEVPMMGVTSSLAFSKANEEVIEEGRHVFIVGASGKIKQRLDRRVCSKRSLRLAIDHKEALQKAMALVQDNGFEQNLYLTQDTIS